MQAETSVVKFILRGMWMCVPDFYPANGWDLWVKTTNLNLIVVLEENSRDQQTDNANAASIANKGERSFTSRW